MAFLPAIGADICKHHWKHEIQHCLTTDSLVVLIVDIALNSRGRLTLELSVQAIICGVYHYCDQHRVGTDLDGPVCSETTYRSLAVPFHQGLARLVWRFKFALCRGFWHLADHGMAYFAAALTTMRCQAKKGIRGFWHPTEIMLQMAFLILGPEDPTLRRDTTRDAWSFAREPSASSGLAPSCGGGSLVESQPQHTRFLAPDLVS